MEQTKFSVTRPTKEDLRESCTRLAVRLQAVEVFFAEYPAAKEDFMTWLACVDDAGGEIEMIDAQEVHAVREYFAMGE